MHSANTIDLKYCDDGSSDDVMSMIPDVYVYSSYSVFICHLFSDIVCDDIVVIPVWYYSTYIEMIVLLF